MQNNHSSMNDDYLPKLEIVNYNLESIANYIEMNSVFIVTPGSTVKDLNYDVSLDLTNIDSLKKSLQFHGLGLKELESDVEFLDINFY